MLGQQGRHDLEGVQRPPGAGGVDFGVEDRKTGLIEVTANAGKQVGLVWREDQHLQTFTDR